MEIFNRKFNRILTKINRILTENETMKNLEIAKR